MKEIQSQTTRNKSLIMKKVGVGKEEIGAPPTREAGTNPEEEVY